MSLEHADRIENLAAAALGAADDSPLDPDAAELLSWQRASEQQILELGSFLSQARSSAERGLEAMASFASLVGRAAEVSTARLGTAVTTLPELAARDADERRLVQSLQADLGAAHRSVQELSSRMTTLAQLALLARMETAALAEHAQGFEGFTSEVDGLVERAEQTVAALDSELSKLLQGVGDIQRIDRRGGAAHVPDTVQRIGTLLEKAAHRRVQGTEAMTAVGLLLERLRQETARLVMGLQFHDGMRQRLEHIGFGLERLRVVRKRGILADDDPAPLDERQRRTAIGALCTLQAAQLRDLADLVERECSSVAAALQEMGRSVVQAEQLFRTAWGRGADDVMAELDEAVGGVAGMVQGYAHIRTAMTASREHALQGIERMSGLAADLDEVEMAIRMAGLNATFRSAQLGGVGGPMKCIAQELRGSAGQIGQAVAAFGTELAAIAAAVGRLRDHAARDPAERRAELTEGLRDGTLALRQMEAEGDQLQELVGQALAGLAGAFQSHARQMAGLGGASEMRTLASQLDGLARLEGQDAPDGKLWPALDRLLKGTYTTKNERDVHQSMHSGATGHGASPACTNEVQEVDDILF